jgi:hypothetical protein
MGQTPYSELSDEALVGLLFTQEDRLPRSGAEEIVRRGARVAERLIEILDREDLWTEDTPRAWAVVHATILLARQRLASTMDSVLRALERADRYSVDSICDLAPELLAAYSSAALPTLEAVARDRSRPPFVRIWTTQALSHIAREAKDLGPSVARALREIAANEYDDPDVRASAGFEMLPFVRKEDRELLLELSDPELLTPELIERALAGGLAPVPPSREDVLGFYDPAEREARRKRWEEEERAGEGTDPDEWPEADPSAQILGDLDQDPNLTPPPLRRESSPGRNDPCPCGSGKKYKKCCGP